METNSKNSPKMGETKVLIHYIGEGTTNEAFFLVDKSDRFLHSIVMGLKFMKSMLEGMQRPANTPEAFLDLPYYGEPNDEARDLLEMSDIRARWAAQNIEGAVLGMLGERYAPRPDEDLKDVSINCRI